MSLQRAMPKFHVMEDNPEQRRLVFWCPGCRYYHWVRTRGPAPVWTFNEDFERPPVRASILVNGFDPAQRCHSFVTDGRIEFLGDCGHELRGQTVDLPECEW